MSKESETEEEIEEELSTQLDQVHRSLWDLTGWVPPFEQVRNHKTLDTESIQDDDLEGEMWSMYLAGKMEAYDHARQIVHAEFKDE